MRALPILASLWVAACSCSGAGPTAAGPTPYVRCAMREPAPIDATVGALHLHGEGRTLTIEGAAAPLRIAAFRGAALAEEPLEPALDEIEAGGPALQIALGSLGDDAAYVQALLTALATLSTPTLVVLGGRDHPADLDTALAALPPEARARIVDASAYRRIDVGGVELIPAAGAPEGRYARDDEACGLGAGDAESIASDVGEAEGAPPRFLISFAGPAPLPGIDGGEAGSASIAALAEAVGARATLYAWPDAAGTATALLVPPLAGPPALLADGARLSPGALGVTLSETGAAPAAP